jgi:hypothetical protein
MAKIIFFAISIYIGKAENTFISLYNIVLRSNEF